MHAEKYRDDRNARLVPAAGVPDFPSQNIRRGGSMAMLLWLTVLITCLPTLYVSPPDRQAWPVRRVIVPRRLSEVLSISPGGMAIGEGSTAAQEQEADGTIVAGQVIEKASSGRCCRKHQLKQHAPPGWYRHRMMKERTPA